MPSGTMIRKIFSKSRLMAPRYEVGQIVIITPVKNQHLSPRDSSIDPFAGQIGKIVDYYWLNSHRGEAFYIYIVRIETSHTEVALHEDELEAYVT